MAPRSRRRIWSRFLGPLVSVGLLSALVPPPVSAAVPQLFPILDLESHRERVTYQGPRTAGVGESIQLKARVWDHGELEGVSRRLVTFQVAGQTLTDTTDAGGMATVTLDSLSQGSYPVRVESAGTRHHPGDWDEDLLLVGADEEALVSLDASLSRTDLTCGQSATVSLELSGTPPTAQTAPLDVALVMDVSESMEGKKLNASREAATLFAGLLDEASDGQRNGVIRSSQIALVPFHHSAWVAADLTGNAALLEQKIAGLRAWGFTAIHDGIATGQHALASGGKPGNQPVMILLSDGESSFHLAEYAADRAKEAGIELFTIGLGAHASERVLREVASHPKEEHYYHSPDSEDLEEIYSQIAQSATGPAATDLLITAEVAPDFALDEAAISPAPADIDGNTITWAVPQLGDETLSFTYQVSPESVGALPVHRSATLKYTNARGEEQTAAFPDLTAAVSCQPEDTEAPITAIAPDGTEGKDGWWTSAVTVALSAVDRPSGSPAEVAATEYSLDDGATWQRYSDPFPLTEEGTHTVKARSRDTVGNQEEPPVTAEIRIDRTPPDVVATAPDDGVEGAAVTLDASATTDATSGVDMVEWDLDGDGTFEAEGEAVSHTWPDNGTYTVSVRAIDEAGNQAEAPVKVEIANVAPDLDAPDDQTVPAGEEADLELGTFYDPGADAPWSVQVDWGDGSDQEITANDAGSLGDAAHTYAAPGTYTVSLTVTDKDGSAETERFEVKAEGAPECEPVDWKSPLRAEGVAEVAMEETLTIRFSYHGCAGFVRDESVVIVVSDLQTDREVTTWVYGLEIVIDEEAEEYRVDFEPRFYGLTEGQELAILVFMRDELVGEATIRMAP